MDIKFINKHKIGIVALLFFILLVSRENSLHFLMNNILGRFLLILLILGISSFSVVLGIIAVLFVIIMLNKDNSIFLEAFDPEINSDKSLMDKSLTDNNLTDKSLTDKQKDDLKKIQDKLKSTNTQQDMIATTSVSSTNLATETFRGGREGFNTTDRERRMQTGKNSNEIPTNNDNQNAENVEPFFNGMFSSTPTPI